MHVFPIPLLFVFFKTLKTLNILPNAQCDETFEKKCQITFRSKAVTEPVSSFLGVHFRMDVVIKEITFDKKRKSSCKYNLWSRQGKLKTRTNFEQQKTTKKQMTGVGESSQTDSSAYTFYEKSLSEWEMEILRHSCSYSNKEKVF